MAEKSELTVGRASFSIETGRLAKQANGAVAVQAGGTVVLVTAVATPDPVPDRGFFPLMVEYRERSYAAGKIPGGFFKREGRPLEREILSARLIDRPLRPLFPKGFLNEVQIIATVLSTDQENAPDVLALVGASAAVALSSIPIEKTIGAVRIGRVKGELVVNPSLAEREESDMDLVVVAARDSVVMVEGGGKEFSERDMVEALRVAHVECVRIIDAIEDLRRRSGREKMAFVRDDTPEKIKERVRALVGGRIDEANRFGVKEERRAYLHVLEKEIVAALGEEFPEKGALISAMLDDVIGEEARKKILSGAGRLDGRKTDEIRPITCEVGVLPRTHGSALFTRGQTQALVAITLGTTSDEQRMDDIEGEWFKKFMLHYNFPPFSVNEVRMIRGTGRREVGHGALAERSIKPMIPDSDTFPYTVRIVADILESNGSSSMASICGGTLALMDAGVPITKPVAGIAMGLVAENGKVCVLSDILGQEDHFGDMDFKVAGTRDGITGFQMDLKTAGIGFDVIEQALDQARRGRLFILDKMEATLAKPRPELSPFAPRILTIKIHTDKIREIIGPGGKMIRKIQEESGASIDIEDDGTVKIASVDEEAGRKAMEMIKAIVEEPEIGRVYEGTVRRIVPFGAFVEILPGKDGLLHISELENRRVAKVEDVVNEGDKIQVKVINIDEEGKVRLSRKALLVGKN
ncbi:MAG: polyribonucleotide nucleotidyltransferase [Candidatus Latescibacterota bacterium]|nr:MAG: polyribonucleotide nucleotidyltransferase [Candidatus Latescibacterota bacterium]